MILSKLVKGRASGNMVLMTAFSAFFIPQLTSYNAMVYTTVEEVVVCMYI